MDIYGRHISDSGELRRLSRFCVGQQGFASVQGFEMKEKIESYRKIETCYVRSWRIGLFVVVRMDANGGIARGGEDGPISRARRCGNCGRG